MDTQDYLIMSGLLSGVIATITIAIYLWNRIEDTPTPTRTPIRNPRRLTWAASEFYYVPMKAWLRLTIDFERGYTRLDKNTNPKRPETEYTRTTWSHPTVAPLNLLKHALREHILHDRDDLRLSAHPTLASVLPHITSDIMIQSEGMEGTTARKIRVRQRIPHHTRAKFVMHTPAPTPTRRRLV